MKEILYIQAGFISNYVGTHFWNTQESYMHAEDPEVDPNVSFCESVDAQETSTLYPRLLTFDKKSNFGTLGDFNATENGDSPTSLWGGPIAEFRQEQITNDHRDSTTSATAEQNRNSGKIRYWSDFSRVYYLPRSLQKIPDPPDWETDNLNWAAGQELFERYNEESELMEGALRLFVEDCDNIQGIQVINDTNTFGSFMSSFFESFRDEYRKLPSFAFPVLSGAATPKYDGGQSQRTKQIVNEALYLRTLDEFSSMNILIQEPELRSSTGWSRTMNKDSRSGDIYQESAVLSSHIETATLPFRLNRTSYDVSSVCAQLNWRGNARFGELSGIFPFSSPSDLQNKLHNFSCNLPIQASNIFARFDVTRGFSQANLNDYEAWTAKNQSSATASYFTHIRGRAYPLPSSFPTAQLVPSPQKAEGDPFAKVPLYTSTSTTSNTSRVFEKYASSIEELVKTRSSTLLATEIPLDDLKDLVNDLWTMHYNSSGDSEEMDL
ncbi:tubulin nucleotide-binding domain-like protein [Agrocybe pediades]|nr:tubulin nucleotide-binding domain-like protein [Agrocybe pediades]